VKGVRTAAVACLTTLALVAVISRSEPQEKKNAPPAPGIPVYNPPLRGAPGGRVGGGTRGTGREGFVLSVLAPDHTGLTVNEQPSLYWFISNPSSVPVEVTVTDPAGTQPLLELQLPPPIQRGVHRIRLADHGVRLAPGVPYRWFVAVVADPSRRSRDILAGGAIERIALPEGLRPKLAQADKARLPFLYAEAGLWYDAFGAISELIESAPNDAELRKQRAALVAQAGLPELPEYATP
jgi:hypothetical protein